MVDVFQNWNVGMIKVKHCEAMSSVQRRRRHISRRGTCLPTFESGGGTGCTKLEQLQMPSGKLLALLVLLTVIYPIVVSPHLLRIFV